MTTVLELRFASLRLTTEKTGMRINPDLHLTMRLETRVVRTGDNTVLYWCMAEHRSTEVRTLVAWGTNGAQAFRTELEVGLQAVVVKILDRLFLAEASAEPAAQSPGGPCDSCPLMPERAD